jgi:hypothetical protein
MEEAFNPCAEAAQPTFQMGCVLVVLISTARRPDQIVGLVKDAGLPLQPKEEAFVGDKESTLLELLGVDMLWKRLECVCKII